MAAAQPPLLEQSPDGLLMLGAGGERLTAGHDFYAAFATSEEYRVLHGGQTLGTIPLEQVLLPGQTLILAGRRWRVLEVDADARVILVEPSNAAMLPRFDGGSGIVHDHVVAEMRRVLSSADVPAFLDRPAASLLQAARHAFGELGLNGRSIIEVGAGVAMLPWVGTRRLDTLAACFFAMNHKAQIRRHFIEVENCDLTRITRVLARIEAGDHPDAQAIAAAVPAPALAKYDAMLSPELLRAVVLAERLDVGSLSDTAAVFSRH